MKATTLALGSLTVATLLAAGCASMRVGSYVARDTDFSTYRTYTWASPDAVPIGDARLENNRIFVDYLQGAVERGLREHHLLLVPASAHPDLLVHFHASVHQVLDVAAASRGHEYGVSEEVEVVKYDEGTLVVDLVDARTDRLVWRGWAIDSLNGILESQDRMVQKINEAVVRMLADFHEL
jgi:hypothetical protein